ncbi:MAG: hypothetical protein MCSN_3570 [Candidatus Microsyncoccus archaeolyticus]|nr:MAG: hypothetical protein MCSN_3570 [Candidatus Parcubacteria bacterium]
MFTYKISKEERVELLLEKEEFHKAARYCFCSEPSREVQIKVIKKFIERKRIIVESEDIDSLKTRTLRCLLYYCILTEQSKSTPRVIITKVDSRRRYKPL